jgi:hypothetical protein
MSMLTYEQDYSEVYATMDLDAISAMEKMVEEALSAHEVYSQLPAAHRVLFDRMVQEALCKGEIL